MVRQVISEKFRAFYDALNANIFTIDEMVSLINRALPDVAPEFSLGRVETIFIAPESVYEPKGLYKVIAGYEHPDGFNEETYKKEFNTAEGGIVRLFANAEKNHTWSQEELKDIDFLLEVLYIACSRFRLLSLMRQTQKTDMLTGSLNMVGLQEKIGELKKSGELVEYSSIFSNLKNFKYINQHVGSQNGDYILKQYSILIRGFLEGEGFFCRLGGDNFVTLVKKYCLLRYLAFVSNITIPVTVGGRQEDVRIDAKSGIFHITEDATLDDVISCASVAFMIARRSNKHDIVYFQQEMLDRAIHDKRISARFSDALFRNEFCVYYQPKVTLADNMLCGCEALTRWHANKILYPGEFVEILEREGSIRNLDFYMLEQVCGDIRRWIDGGIEPVRVSVNFSKLHLSGESFEKDIISVLQKYSVDPKYIEIELTELSDFKYFDRLVSFVDTMHRHGFHISIDDFGTGYSSMSLICGVNADVIKLDKTLIDNLVSGKKQKTDAVIVRSIISMAHELGIQVIAEGVESCEQADFLRANGCLMAQGFLYDKALVREDFEKRLASRQYNV